MFLLATPDSFHHCQPLLAPSAARPALIEAQAAPITYVPIHYADPERARPEIATSAAGLQIWGAINLAP